MGHKLKSIMKKQISNRVKKYLLAVFVSAIILITPNLSRAITSDDLQAQMTRF